MRFWVYLILSIGLLVSGVVLGGMKWIDAVTMKPLPKQEDEDE